MKFFKWLPLILFFACINVITQTNFFNSLFFQGGSWMETARMESMKMGDNSNDYTLQFWVSGSDVYASDGPALFSLIDSNGNIKLALSRDSGDSSAISIDINSDNMYIPNLEIDWTNADDFYLISILFSNSQGLKGYVNDNIFLDEPDKSVNVINTKLMIGVIANEQRTILGNFWYGYMDEIRLWNTWLSDSTIQFQTEHPNKFGEYYRYTEEGEGIETFLDSLIGLWRFNLSEATATIIDESEHGNNGTIYTLPNFSIELSNKGTQ